MSNEKELVSIIIAAYNAEKYISKSIQSVLSQTHHHFDALVINDGSFDQTEKIVQSFHDPRIKYFFQENRGVSAARNVGLQNMQGDYFCFLDADDVLPSNSLESRLIVFKKAKNIEFVDGKVEVYNQDFSKKIKTWYPGLKGKPLEDLLNLTGKSFLGNTWMIKRNPKFSYQFKEGLSHCEDLFFYIQLARNDGFYSYTNETVLHYRTGHLSSMNNLKGLENGYRSIYQEIQKMQDISNELKLSFLQKAKNIVWKSYLGNGYIGSALKSLIQNW